MSRERPFTTMANTVPRIGELFAELFPRATVVGSAPLGGDAAEKAMGYGVPVRVSLVDPDGAQRDFVFRTAGTNDYGHDRRADRAAEQLLAFDTFGRVPRHVLPVDVGAIAWDGRCISLRDTGELYLVTTYAPGRPYADDLARVARGRAGALDMARCRTLASYLADLHRARGGRPKVYERAVRDLIGHGEGIFGIVDGYPDRTPGAPRGRLETIEAKALTWRWRLRDKSHRLARIHGDFHPFNILFDEGLELTALDAARGSEGEPADDVCAMAVNYVFFALREPGAWTRGLGALWHTFWETYLRATDDDELLEVAAPFLMWRLLVLASPDWYRGLSEEQRDRLLALGERALDATRFDPSWAEDVFS